MSDYWSKDDNYLDWLKDEERVCREEARFDDFREPEDADLSQDEDEDDGNDWTEEDERAATRECW